MNHNAQPNNTLFVTLADESCYFVPTTSDMNLSMVDDLVSSKARFSVHLFDKGGSGLSTNHAHTRIMRTVYGGPVVAEIWDNRNYEWIPA